MLKSIFISILLVGFFPTAEAQKDEVEKTINNLFKGMLEGDSSLVHSTFHDEVSMFTTFVDDQGVNQLREGSLESFLNAVGTPHEEAWNEVISGLHIEVDDGLAQAWMNYSFYRGDQFSHCGVNTMQLVKVNQIWKILHLIDTRRKDNCNQ
jgi:hypothetical protein